MRSGTLGFMRLDPDAGLRSAVTVYRNPTKVPAMPVASKGDRLRWLKKVLIGVQQTARCTIPLA
jgi:hypothetical protein